MKNRNRIIGTLVALVVMCVTIVCIVRPVKALEDRVPYANEMRALAGIQFGITNLTAGVATVNDPYLTTNDVIQLTPYAQGTTIGVAGTTNVCQVSNVVAGTSFQIVEMGAVAASTNKVAWLILRNPPRN